MKAGIFAALAALILPGSAVAQSVLPLQQATQGYIRQANNNQADARNQANVDQSSVPAAGRNHQSAANERRAEAGSGPKVTDVFLAIITAGLLAVALWQGRVIRNQLTLTYPPRLRVTRLILWAHTDEPENEDRRTPPSFNAGQRIDGVAWAINYGRETAYVTEWDCLVRFYEHLPMNPPYPLPSENRAVFCMGKTDVPVRELKPGEAGRFRYSFVVPDDFTGESDQRKLWVMGRILFRDRLKTHRAVFFARNYDFARANFRRSKHSEYECEE